MDDSPAMSAESAQVMLDRVGQLSPEDVHRILRFLKRSNDDLVNKIRMLKSEVGRVARR